MIKSVDRLRKELEKRSSEELISILRNRDEEEWRPEVFKTVALVLKDRGISPEEVIAMGPEGTDVVESEPTVTIANFFSPLETSAHAQFLIATHSPIILSYPGAVLFSLHGDSIREIAYRETEHYRVTRDFLNSPERYFKHLFRSERDEESNS